MLEECASDFPLYPRSNGDRLLVAELAQEFIHEHYREQIRVEDVCRVTGLRLRTLQRYFREYFGFTLSDYLETVRLDAARRELLAARPTRDSVTDIALRHGFTHLGRFSVEFRQRFGDLPREALRMHEDRKLFGEAASKLSAES